MENFIEYWQDEEYTDILHGMYKKDSIITLNVAKEIVKSRLEFQNGRIFKTIVYVTNLKFVTIEARRYYAKYGYEGLEKMAIIATSDVRIILSNLYIKIDKPVKPTKLFKDVTEAKKWLQSI